MNSTAMRRLIYTELLLAVREPAAMFLSVVLPLAVFLALGFSVGTVEIEVDRDIDVVELFHVRDVLLAGNIAWVTAIFGIVSLPQTLVEFRQHGVFRRYRVTPMPSYMLIAAPLVVGAAVIVVSLALMLVVGWRVFDIRFAGNAAMVALAIAVSYLAFATLGTAITARIRNVRTALGLGLALFAPMFVLSGAFGPRETFPAALRAVGDWLPLTHSYDLLTYLWLGGTWEVETTIGTPNLGLLRLSGRDSGGLCCRQRTIFSVGLSDYLKTTLGHQNFASQRTWIAERRAIAMDSRFRGKDGAFEIVSKLRQCGRRVQCHGLWTIAPGGTSA